MQVREPANETLDTKRTALHILYKFIIANCKPCYTIYEMGNVAAQPGERHEMKQLDEVDDSDLAAVGYNLVSPSLSIPDDIESQVLIYIPPF